MHHQEEVDGHEQLPRLDGGAMPDYTRYFLGEPSGHQGDPLGNFVGDNNNYVKMKVLINGYCEES